MLREVLAPLLCHGLCAGFPRLDEGVLLLQELCLPYEVSAGDLDEAEPQAMLLLVTYLFTALPQLLPRATLDFSCKLGDQQVCYMVPFSCFFR